MILSPLLALLACSGGCGGTAVVVPLPNGTFPSDSLDRTGAGPVYAFHVDPLRSAGRYALTDSNVPASATAPQVVPIDLAARRKANGPVSLPFPFTVDDAGRRSLAEDVTLTVGGRQLEYAPLGGGAGTWRLKANELVINAPGDAASLEYRGAARLLARRSVAASGLAPAAFVEHTLTLDGVTRNGLLLTTPSSAAWQVEIPKDGGAFSTFVALDPPSYQGAGTSDGLVFVLRVDGQEVVREAVSGVGFREVRADLTPFAGRSVEVVFATEGHGTPDLDYLFLGSPTIWGPPAGEPVRRVIVLGLDTTRPDRMTWYGSARGSTPELDELANQSAVMIDAWTPAPRTRPSFRAATTGRYPLEAIGATNLGAVFRDHGFATAGIVANMHLQPRFDFDDGFDLWWFDGKSRANEQVNRALSWLDANKDRDSYLFLHIMDPHLPYTPPPAYVDRFVAAPDPTLKPGFTRTQVKGWTRKGSLTPERAEHIRGLYDGEMAYTSAQIGRLVTAIDALPGRTLIVVHSDHGEEMWEHGDFEHNHTLYDEVTRAVLWVRPPGGTQGGPVRVTQPATLADIGPTLYDFAGFTKLPVLDGISLRPFMLGAAPDPARPIGIAHIQYGVEQWGVVADGHKYIVTTGTGAEELYALVPDPGELNDLAATTPLDPWRKALVAAHPGLQAGPGWRVHVSVRPGDVIELTLPTPAVAADVLDPETLTASRANQAWGEIPEKTSADVGTVALVDGGAKLQFTGGPRAEGILWVLFPEATPADGLTASVNGSGVALQPRSTGELDWTGAAGSRVRAMPGFVVVPPPDEAVRMASGATPASSTDHDETCRLCVLGYKQGPDCDLCEEH